MTDKDYRATFIHEYLIPNEAVVSPQVWMRQFHAVGDALNKTVKELVMEKSDSSENQDKQLVRKQVINQVETIDSNNGLRPVIRFARLPIKKFKNRLGRDERYRVFASDLAEVWNRKLQDAANLSGYNTNDGDEFFIFVYLPLNPDQAVPATWDEVLKHIPTWFKEGENRGE